MAFADFSQLLKPKKQVCVVKRKELQAILRRALNTMEPQKMPSWAYQMADALDSGAEIVITLIDD